jgi:hypothetical protein
MSRSSAPESILSLYSPDVDLEENFLYGGGASILGRCISRLFFAHLSFFPHKNTLFFNAIPVSHTHRRAKPIHTSLDRAPRTPLKISKKNTHWQQSDAETASPPSERRGRRLSFQHMIESPPPSDHKFIKGMLNVFI